MEISLRHQPSYTIAYVMLDGGERVFVERHALAAMSSGVSAKATAGGTGVGRALLRSAFGGEDFIFTCYQAELYDAWIAVAPAYPGDIAVLDIDGTAPMLLQTGSLLAYSDGVDVGMRAGGVRSIVMQEGLAFLRAGGVGSAVISSYGAIEQLAVGDGEHLVVDTGHLVGFSESMPWRLEMLGSAATAALSGEGIVARFEGPGTVILQTRAERELRSWLLPERQQNNPS